MKLVTLVGGGTAGHVEPALAVGNWLMANSPDIKCDFVGTSGGVEADLLPKTNLHFHKILKAPFPRSFSVATIIWPVKFLLSVLQSLKLLNGSKLVIGFGGYVSAPVYLAARIRNIPIIIHEANAKPGWANKVGARFTDKVTIAFEGAKSLGGRWGSAKLVGMPIRSEIRAVRSLSDSQITQLKLELSSKLNLNPMAKNIFIFGGSLGAKRINDVIAASVTELIDRGYNVIHSVGRGNQLPAARFGYAPLSYIENMAQIYAISDLVIARSGAVSCAEIASVDRYALLIPLSIGNGEQEANAQDLVANGRAQICLNSAFNSEWLMSNLNSLMQSASLKRNRVLNSADLPADAMIGQMALEVLGRAN